MTKPKEFWMDTDLLDKALDNCDLGDGYSAKVRQYPHKDMIPELTHVIEYSAYEAACKERDEACLYSRDNEERIFQLEKERDKLRAELEELKEKASWARITPLCKKIEKLRTDLAVAVEFIQQFKECRCPEAWIHRQRHAPECVSDEVEEVFAKIRGKK